MFLSFWMIWRYGGIMPLNDFSRDKYGIAGKETSFERLEDPYESWFNFFERLKNRWLLVGGPPDARQRRVLWLADHSPCHGIVDYAQATRDGEPPFAFHRRQATVG
jgi:hypothetical protein